MAAQRAKTAEPVSYNYRFFDDPSAITTANNPQKWLTIVKEMRPVSYNYRDLSAITTVTCRDLSAITTVTCRDLSAITTAFSRL